MRKLYFILSISVLILIGVWAYTKYRVAPKIEFAQLDLTDLEGNKMTLESFAGKNIFITMWAPWCRDCLVEMPALQYVKDKLKDDNFVFLAISDFNIEKEKAYANRTPYDFQYLHMKQTLKEIGIHAIPTNYILNSKGKIVYQKIGAEADWKSAETIEMIRNLVK